ncbi:MAG: SdrD B-like domain-containing protein, partial [Planctomycetaceae bacterium]
MTSISPGETVTLYGLVSYPVVDSANRSLAGQAPVTEDDIVLNYDIWATAVEGAENRFVYDEREITGRNEIAAMANKISPNTDGKVPDKYLDAIEAALGWRPAVGEPRIPGALISEGIWYDLGNIGMGFDNDGDQIPDRNAWLQPVGDADAYDALSHRLAKAYGLLVIKLNDGTEQLIPFEDQLYFSNIPSNNRGGVGLVYYEYLPITFETISTLSPYQEVASGFDNEKFNGDYGAGGATLSFPTPDLDFAKAGAVTGSTITYTISATNNEPVKSYGFTKYALPPVIEDAIPAGTVYVADSAAGTLVPSGTEVTVLFSTDNGSTWTRTEPADASTVTNLQWWLSDDLPAGQRFTVQFSAQIPTDYASPILENCAELSVAALQAAFQSCDSTELPGTQNIGDTVFADTGAGAGTAGDGIQNGTEPGLASVAVTLYADTNANQSIDAEDVQLAATSTDAAGNYLFSSLRNGDYLVYVDAQSAAIPNGYVSTTGTTIAVTLDNADDLTADFGFSPVVGISKAVDSETVYEGQDVTYTLTVENLLKSSGSTSAQTDIQTLWMTSASGTFTNPGNAAGNDSTTFATGTSTDQTLILSDPADPTTAQQTTPIKQVAAIFEVQAGEILSSTEFLTVQVIQAGSLVDTQTITAESLNAFVSSQGLVSVNLASLNGWTWESLTATDTQLSLSWDEKSGETIQISRAGFRVTSVSSDARLNDIFWSDGSNTLKTGSVNGTSIDSLLTDLPDTVSAIAIDVSNNRIFAAYANTIA